MATHAPLDRRNQEAGHAAHFPPHPEIRLFRTPRGSDRPSPLETGICNMLYYLRTASFTPHLALPACGWHRAGSPSQQQRLRQHEGQVPAHDNCELLLETGLRALRSTHQSSQHALCPPSDSCSGPTLRVADSFVNQDRLSLHRESSCVHHPEMGPACLPGPQSQQVWVGQAQEAADATRHLSNHIQGTPLCDTKVSECLAEMKHLLKNKKHNSQ